MSWFTSTPISFGGGSDFFCRDSGLVCKGLQSLGLQCKSVMPLPVHSGDIVEDLIRTDSANLASPEWWNSIGAENVVLYSWGHHKYYEIAEAIKNSGAKLFVNLDSGGIISPTVTPALYYKAVFGRQIRLHGQLLGTFAGTMRSLFYRFRIPIFIEPGRVKHLRAATAIGCISPAALELWRLWARVNAPDLIEKMYVVPNPVASYLKYDSIVEKQDSVVTVGRWDDVEVKRPEILIDAIRRVAECRAKTEFHIVGSTGKKIEKLFCALPSGIRKRVHLHGRVAHGEILDMFMRSRVGMNSSSHEGSHVASEEALCAGASIVATCRMELNALHWYVSHSSGRLAIDDSSKGLAEALLLELETWDRGERNAVSISSFWNSKLSAAAVASRIQQILG